MVQRNFELFSYCSPNELFMMNIYMVMSYDKKPGLLHTNVTFSNIFFQTFQSNQIIINLSLKLVQINISWLKFIEFVKFNTIFAKFVNFFVKCRIKFNNKQALKILISIIKQIYLLVKVFLTLSSSHYALNFYNNRNDKFKEFCNL